MITQVQRGPRGFPCKWGWRINSRLCLLSWLEFFNINMTNQSHKIPVFVALICNCFNFQLFAGFLEFYLPHSDENCQIGKIDGLSTQLNYSFNLGYERKVILGSLGTITDSSLILIRILVLLQIDHQQSKLALKSPWPGTELEFHECGGQTTNNEILKFQGSRI